MSELSILIIMVVLLGGAHLYAQAEIARRLDRIADLLDEADTVAFDPEEAADDMARMSTTLSS